MENSLTIKTKIAAWWMMLIGLFGGIGLLLSLMTMVALAAAAPRGVDIFVILVISSLFLFPFFSGIFLLKMKKWAWWFSVIILLIGVIFSQMVAWFFGFFPLVEPTIYILFLIPFLIPLILLLLDRKNFFKVAK